MFPISLPTQWHPTSRLSEFSASSQAADWIQSQGSLTVRIRELGIAFNLEVLSQTEQALTKEQRALLETQDDSGLIREVLLKQGACPLVYAQTLIPESTSSGTESMLTKLGSQSLGQVLFQSPQATRGQIEFAQVLPDSELANYIENQLGQPIVQACFIRRSRFLLNQKPLLVSECFLPALFPEIEAN